MTGESARPADAAHEGTDGGAAGARRSIGSEAFLAALVQASPDAIVSTDEEGRVVTWNAAAERLLGSARADAIGRDFRALIGARSLSAPATDEHGVRRHAVAFRRADGETGYGELIETHVDWNGARMSAIILHDETEIRSAHNDLAQQAATLHEKAGQLEAANRTLQQRGAELEAALRAHGRFYRSMSHELRTPLSAVIGYNALLLEGIFGELSAEQHDRLSRGQRAARHLLELVNDTLDLARIEAAPIELHPEAVRFPDILFELRDTVHSVASEHNVEISFDGPPDSHSIRTDARRLRQIMLNLLSNAIRFGEGRPVHVLWSADDDGVIIAIRDEGPGIAADALPGIFEEFAPGSRVASSGTGLGLPISRRLAELLGGRITVESAHGHGSTFRLFLPDLERRPELLPSPR